jgi:hypothetical protein
MAMAVSCPLLLSGNEIASILIDNTRIYEIFTIEFVQ